MRYVLQLIFILAAYTVSAQNFSGQAYMMGKEYSQVECKTITALDTCSGDLVFLSRKKFIMITRCGDGESHQEGKYIVKNKNSRWNFLPRLL